VTAPLLAELEARRARLFERLAPVGDFRRGSISENYRTCGKPNCACAQPGHCGHHPRWLWTRTVPGRGTTGRQLAAGEVEKVRGELARFQEFAVLSEQIVEVSEAICEARHGGTSRSGLPPGQRGLCDALAEAAAEVARLAGAAAHGLVRGGGLEAVELALRAGAPFGADGSRGALPRRRARPPAGRPGRRSGADLEPGRPVFPRSHLVVLC
jgi:hypothetical protein